MNADHLLHYTPGSEGYGTWRLECVHGTEGHGVYYDDIDWPDQNTCLCTQDDDNDCESCKDGDHGGCGFYGQYIFDLGYDCRMRYDGTQCWAVMQFSEYGAECIHGDAWPEDGPWPCYAEGVEYVEIRYAAPLPTAEEMERDAKADDEFKDAMDS